MNVEIVKSEKNEVELNMDNSTIAEVMRVYLNEVGAEFAAWRKEHYSKPIVMLIKSEGKTVKKLVSEAVAAVEKDIEGMKSVVKKK